MRGDGVDAERRDDERGEAERDEQLRLIATARHRRVDDLFERLRIADRDLRVDLVDDAPDAGDER